MRRCLTIMLVLLACQAAAAATTTKTLSSAKPGCYTAQASYPQFTDKTPVAALANRVVAGWVNGAVASFVKESTDTCARSNRPPGPYFYRATALGIYAAPTRLISVRADVEWFVGGAHPTFEYQVFNAGRVGNVIKRLVLADMFRAGGDYYPRVTALILNNLQRDPRASFVSSGEVKTLTDAQLNRFVATSRGLTFLFNPAEAGPYVAGPLQVSLSIRELGPDFNRAMIGAR